MKYVQNFHLQVSLFIAHCGILQYQSFKYKLGSCRMSLCIFKLWNSILSSVDMGLVNMVKVAIHMYTIAMRLNTSTQLSDQIVCSWVIV